MTIPTDVTENQGMTDESAIEAILSGMRTDKAPTTEAPLAAIGDDGDEDPTDEDGDLEEGEDPTDEDEDPEEEGEGKGPEPKPETAPVEDTAVIKVTVDGVETEVTVGSLKRLAGQEASLTRKSQEADLVGGRAALVLQGALNGVVEDLEPYRDLDWNEARTSMDPEEFAWHRDNFNRNKVRYDGLMQNAQDFEAMTEQRQSEAVAEQAAEASAILSADIPGWGDALYGQIMDYAVSSGLDTGDVRKIANADVIKLLNKARLYDEGLKVTAEKVNLAPTRVRSGAGREAVAPTESAKQQTLKAKVMSGRGTDDDAIALLVGRWKK